MCSPAFAFYFFPADVLVYEVFADDSCISVRSLLAPLRLPPPTLISAVEGISFLVFLFLMKALLTL
jgi:hypothetical protein